jgi:regulator of replication initiation timing
MAGRKVKQETLDELTHQYNEIVKENKELVFENELIRRQNTMLLELLESVVDENIIPDQTVRFRMNNVLNNVVEMK